MQPFKKENGEDCGQQKGAAKRRLFDLSNYKPDTEMKKNLFKYGGIDGFRGLAFKNLNLFRQKSHKKS